jgi:hypothetical protein
MSASFKDRFFQIHGSDVMLDAQPIQRIVSIDDRAWAGESYTTIRLCSPVQAFRLHGFGSTFTNPDESSEKLMSRRTGDWFALGDIILGAAEFWEKSSLPHSFSMLSEFTLPTDAILNVGIASKRFPRATWRDGASRTVGRSGLRI